MVSHNPPWWVPGAQCVPVALRPRPWFIVPPALHPRLAGAPAPPGQCRPHNGGSRGAAGGPGGWGGARAPQLGPTWLEDTEETSVRWAELDTSESSVMGRPHTVSMMQARNCRDTDG